MLEVHCITWFLLIEPLSCNWSVYHLTKECCVYVFYSYCVYLICVKFCHAVHKDNAYVVLSLFNIGIRLWVVNTVPQLLYPWK
jgi:hypothetical protein